MIISDSTAREISRLNGILADPIMGLGSNPFNGGPAFRWVPGSELWYPVQDGQGRSYRKVALMLDGDQDRWVLAQWCPMPMSETQWILQFGIDIDYPKDGYWFEVIRLPHPAFPDLFVPNERLTMAVIAQAKANRHKTEADHYREILAENAAAKQARDTMAGDMVDNALPAFLKVPGSHNYATEVGGIGESKVFGGND